MLDAAQYFNLAWNAILDATIRNAFNKSQLLILCGGADEEVDLMADLLRSFEALNLSLDESAREEFVHIDDENNVVFSQEILDDVNDELETMQTPLENAEDESDHTIAEALHIIFGTNRKQSQFLWV